MPERVSAIGCGEYRTIATNDTKQGTQLNRRVEIIILPKLAKSRAEEEVESSQTNKVEASIEDGDSDITAKNNEFDLNNEKDAFSDDQNDKGKTISV